MKINLLSASVCFIGASLCLFKAEWVLSGLLGALSLNQIQIYLLTKGRKR